MEGVLAASKDAVRRCTCACAATRVYKEEATRLTRHVVKVALVLAELEMQLGADESLRGSQSVFLGAEAACSAAQQCAELLEQCSGSEAAAEWPLEDAVGFQSCALELQGAMGRLAALEVALPPDVADDAAHFARQFLSLSFTPAELEDTAEAELEEVQQRRRAAGEALQLGPAAATAGRAGAAGAAPPAEGGRGAQAEEWGMEQEREALEEEALEEASIPPPMDDAVAEVLEREGEAFVTLEGPSLTALPPGAPVHGAAPPEQQHLPGDPFAQAGGGGAAPGGDTLRQLSELRGKGGGGGAGGGAQP